MQLHDVARAPAPDPSATLFGMVADAMILQDEAAAVLAGVGRREHLGVVAPRGGPLVHRFFTLRDRLPLEDRCSRAGRLSDQLDTILLHHALQVATSLEFLAVEGRSERLAAQLSAYPGLGPPAELLESIYRELRDERDRQQA